MCQLSDFKNHETWLCPRSYVNLELKQMGELEQSVRHITNQLQL